MRLFVISGTSGAGKSIALHALEDLDFYCIDNLPLALLPSFAQELVKSDVRHYENAAVGIDVRNLSANLEAFPKILGELRQTDIDVRIVFVDADDNTLIKRFSETRRRHPLSSKTLALADAIRQERVQLEPIAAFADLQFDTSRTNVHQLRDIIQQQIGGADANRTTLLFQSFGFKHGIPVDADFVFDVRCLPNPHWEPHLRALTGKDREVASFLEGHSEVAEMQQEIAGFLHKWLPRFQADRRSYLTVAIGCTGGQHRSVYMVEALAQHFTDDNAAVMTRHRELP